METALITAGGNSVTIMSTLLTEVGGKHNESVLALEREILQYPQVEPETKHYFAHGTYTREMLIPKGLVLTGKMHKNSCINILSAGKMLIFTDEGSREISAPHTFVSSPVLKKAGYALEDCVFINVFPWDGVKTVEQLEDELVIPGNQAAGLLESF